MKFLKRLRIDKDTLYFADMIKPAESYIILALAVFFLAASVLFGVLCGISIFAGAIFYAAVAILIICGLLFIMLLVLFIYKKRFPYKVAVDGEHIFIRKGLGYIRFDKFEAGTVIYRAKGIESGANGQGTLEFEIENGKFVFKNEIKPIKLKVSNSEKLAFVLLQSVSNPFSGVDWGVAYDSLPENRRSPSSF